MIRAHTFMKKLIQIVVLVIVVSLLMPTQASHAVGKTVLGVSTVYTESTGSVNFSVFIRSDEPIAGGSFELVYDSTMLSVSKSNVKLGDALSSQIKSINNEKDGSVHIAWVTDNGQEMDGDLLNISGRVQSVGKGNTIPLQLKNVHLIDEKGNQVSVQVIQGAIKPFDGKQMTHSRSVAANKEWTITLNEPFNEYSLNKYAVTIKKGSTNVPIIIEPISSTKFKVKPETKYSTGTYTLEITEQLTSLSGSKLKEPVRLEFTVR